MKSNRELTEFRAATKIEEIFSLISRIRRDKLHLKCAFKITENVTATKNSNFHFYFCNIKNYGNFMIWLSDTIYNHAKCQKAVNEFGEYFLTANKSKKKINVMVLFIYNRNELLECLTIIGTN